MKNHYFQFPLCVLSFVQNVREDVGAIIAFASVELGKKQWETFSSNEQQAKRLVLPNPRTCQCSIDPTSDEQLQTVAGCEYLRIRIFNIKGMLADHARVSRFVKEFEDRHGTDARVRIRTDWLFEVRDNKGMSYQELAVLAAIYSKIGASRRPVRITREEIWWRALGYKSQSVFRAEDDGGHVLGPTERQVRSIIERLQSRNFFARITFGRRQTYYSNRLSTKELADEIFTAKMQRSLARQARICADADLTKRIQAARRKLAGSVATESATDAPL
jgi:hypothetical protein